MRNKILIEAVVKAGMFPNERAVVIHTTDGDKSLFAGEDWTREIDGRQYLCVELLEEANDVLLVLLPDEIIGGVRTVTVQRNLRREFDTASAR
ncbi:MAG: hypothetical protein OXI03_10615 [Chloroflexota bacterium]|nr:hypothetical protein [Chloroflexota bacterium]